MVSDADRVAIKSQIVDLMLRMPEAAQKQLSAAVADIGEGWLQEGWPELLPYMVSKFAGDDYVAINGVLFDFTPFAHGGGNVTFPVPTWHTNIRTCFI